MRRRNVVLRLNFTVTSANLKRSTGKNWKQWKWMMLRDHARERIMPQSSQSEVHREIHCFNFYSLNSHNLRSHQKIRHAEYQGEGVTITTVRKSRSSANAHQTTFNAPSHSQTSSLIISPPPPPNILNLNSSDMKHSLPMYKSDWNLKSRWAVSGGNHFYCWCWTCLGVRASVAKSRTNFPRYISKTNETLVVRRTRE